MSALREIVEAVDRSIAEHAVADPGVGRFEREIRDPDRAFVLEAVREGYLLHYGEGRAFAGLDPDLELLGGDTLYALGIARLAEKGDLDGIGELADLIALCARAQAERRPELAEPLWRASAGYLAGAGGEGAGETFTRLAPEP